MITPFKPTSMLSEARIGRQFRSSILILLFLGCFLLSQLLQMIPVGAVTVICLLHPDTQVDLYSAIQVQNSASLQTAVNTLLSKHFDLLMLTQLFSTAFTVALSILVCKWIERRPLSSMGLRKKHAVREYVVGAGIGALLLTVCVGICIALGVLELRPQRLTPAIWLLYLLGFLIQGASEELLCRGFLMVSLTKRHSLAAATLINAVLFSLLHIANASVSPLALLNIALFGILESVYVLKRGNLWGACAMHSMWNFFQGNIFGIPVSGNPVTASPLLATASTRASWLSGGAFGLEGGAVVTAVLTVALLLTLFVIPQNTDETWERNNI